MLENREEELTTVRVQDPRVHNEGSWNSYVDYKIFLHTNSKAFTAKTSCVRRRYREFAWLRRQLQRNAGLVPVPELPGKAAFFVGSTDEFIERRRRGLQRFLERVVQSAVLLSDSRLHLFLQSQLPVGAIELCVQGRAPLSVTDAILHYAMAGPGWGQRGDSAGTAWGQRGDSHGQRGDSPALPWGHRGDSHGQRGDSPALTWGQRGDSPGQRGDSPALTWGQRGDSPGQRGDSPGQAWGQPGASLESFPDWGDLGVDEARPESPAGHGVTPPESPAGHGVTPLERPEFPTGQGVTPLESPAGHGMTPVESLEESQDVQPDTE